MSPANRILASLSALLCIAVAACGASVVGGGGAGGSGGSGGDDTTSGMGGVPATSGGGMGGVGGGSPNAIVYGSGVVTFRVATFPLSCADTMASPPYDQCGWFNLEITLPEGYVEVGTVDISTVPEATLYVSEATPPYSSTPGDCGGTAAVSGGFGSGALSGVLDILDVGPSAVTFTLSGSGDWSSDVNVDGTYVAPRCN